ncbi:MAG: peptide chain release factor N(5)-glutamine methyltransferase [Thermoanaerobaculia bacterium]|nr:peptide chain release factor N(5)-glutamine methyltransferase [Thermoanaerobaculia bacterium]
MLGATEAQLIAHDERTVPAEARERFDEVVRRRAEGEPSAYILGRREFYGRSFEVDSRVLVPRPETEHLISLVLELDLPTAPRILDLGVGSGCIALTLVAEIPRSRVWAVDRSLGALAVAWRNRRNLGVGERAHLIASDWDRALRLREFDLVVCNPPYIDRSQPSEFQPEVAAFEPSEALFAEEGGLADYSSLFAAISERASQVPLVTEIGRGQLEELTALASTYDLRPVRVVVDYAGIERVVLWQSRHNPLPPSPPSGKMPSHG